MAAAEVEEFVISERILIKFPSPVAACALNSVETISKRKHAGDSGFTPATQPGTVLLLG
jgi:hypothetical protein